MVLQLYSKQSDPSLMPLMRALQRMSLTYANFDVEIDSNARSNLLKLTGAELTPTLVFEDGTYLIQPTPKQFSEKMLSIAPKAERIRYEPTIVRLWAEIILVFILGLTVFGLCFNIGTGYTAIAFAGLTLIVAAVGIIFVLLLLLPPGKRLLSAISKLLPMTTFKWLVILILAAVMGLSLGAQHKPFDVLAWIALAIVCIIIAVAAGLLTCEMWGHWTKHLRRMQTWLGIVALIGFLTLLAISLMLHQLTLSRAVLIPQLLLLVMMSGLACVQMVSADTKGTGLDRAMGVLFPTLGTLVLIGLL